MYAKYVTVEEESESLKYQTYQRKISIKLHLPTSTILPPPQYHMVLIPKVDWLLKNGRIYCADKSHARVWPCSLVDLSQHAVPQMVTRRSRWKSNIIDTSKDFSPLVWVINFFPLLLSSCYTTVFHFIETKLTVLHWMRCYFLHHFLFCLCLSFT